MIKNLIKYSLIISLLFSCSAEKVVDKPIEKKYFDLKNYFKLESEALQKLNPKVYKTVAINGDIENNELKIDNWASELSIFTDSDINKANWIGSFEVISTDSSIHYIATDEKITVKNISIKKSSKGIQEIKIIKENKNLVYISRDTLIYKPNTLYQINKFQKVYALKEKSFKILGTFNTN